MPARAPTRARARAALRSTLRTALRRRAGLFVMAGSFALAPFYLRYRNQGNNLTLSDKPLTGSQIMRGAYMNTGSKDVGRDPDWDAATGRYMGSSIQSFQPTEEQIQEHRREMAARKAAAIAAAKARALAAKPKPEEPASTPSEHK
ncbi:hypothetical protein EON67_07005 [archaeon]|nr:MAG: hypothetical protein EON67_07005 [archaeon]